MWREKKSKPLDDKYKTEQNLIEGCQSRVWLQADEENGRIVFQAESDALIVKGIISLLIKVLSGHTPDEILNANAYIRICFTIESNPLLRVGERCSFNPIMSIK